MAVNPGHEPCDEHIKTQGSNWHLTSICYRKNMCHAFLNVIRFSSDIIMILSQLSMNQRLVGIHSFKSLWQPSAVKMTQVKMPVVAAGKRFGRQNYLPLQVKFPQVFICGPSGKLSTHLSETLL